MIQRKNILLNNLGATTELEMLIIQKEILVQLSKSDIEVRRVISGRLLTSLETHGFILTVFKLDPNDTKGNNQILQLLDYPVESKYWMSYTPIQNIFQVYSDQNFLKNQQEKIKYQYSQEGQDLVRKLEGVFKELKNQSENLNQLDAITGDGDIGSGVASSASAVLSILQQNILPLDHNLKNSIQQIGSIISKNFGGTSGALYGAFFYASSSQFENELKENNIHTFLNGVYKGMKAIQEVGQVKIGERTMIDSLEPAIFGAIEAESQGKSQKEIIEIMLEEAKNGAQKAVTLAAQKGRSFYLQGREIGEKDPGCELVCLWIKLIKNFFF